MTKPDLMAELAEVFDELCCECGDEGCVALGFRAKRLQAELEAVVRDAAYGRALREAMEAEYQAAKESRKDGKQEPWITTYTLLRRLKVAADHLSDQAMHPTTQEP